MQRRLSLAVSLLSLAGLARESSSLLYNANGESAAYTGIGRLRGSRTCTAWLLDMKPAPPASAPAYVVTAGHCVGSLTENDILIDTAAGKMEVTFDYFVDTPDRRRVVPAERIAYATMKGADVAIVQLGATYEELTKVGLRPLAIGAGAREGVPVEIVGVPAQGLMTEELFLRKSRCVQGPAVDLLEHMWHWWGMRRNDCLDLKPGISGSPLLAADTRQVLGVVNTTTEDAFDRGDDIDCSLGVPCETGAAGPRVIDWAGYSVPIQGLERCFDEGGRFSLERAGCPLDDNRQVTLRRPGQRVLRPRVTDESGTLKFSTWQATLESARFPYYRYKAVAGPPAACRDAAGYGPVRSLAQGALIDDPIGEKDGHYSLCVLAGESPVIDSKWQRPEFATTAVVRLDGTPPSGPVVFYLEESATAYTLAFGVEGLSDSPFEYKAGAPGEIDCASAAGWRMALSIPLQLDKSREPWLICARALDLALNRGPVTQWRLQGTGIIPGGVVNAASFISGPVAPGSLVSIFGVHLAASAAAAPAGASELAGVTVEITGVHGDRHKLPLVYASQQQVNARLPREISLGEATLELAGAEGRARVTVRVERATPGLFRQGLPYRPVVGFVLRRGAEGAAQREPLWSCNETGSCTTRWIAPPATGEELRLALMGTGVGLAGAPGIRVWLGPEPLTVDAVETLPAQPGVEEIVLRSSRDFALRGCQALQLEASGRKSVQGWICLR